jgi:hypothetical protein
MEGMNLGAMYLIALGVLIFGLSSLVAFVSLLARKFKIARMALATGLLASAILAAFASLTYLADVGQFAPQGAGLIFITMAAVLLLAGVAQFRAAIMAPGRYLFSLALSLAAAGLLPVAIPMGDLFGPHAVSHLRVDARLAIMVLIFSISLAVISCVIGVTPPADGKKPWDGEGELG